MAVSKAIRRGGRRLLPAVVETENGKLLDLDKALLCWERRNDSAYPVEESKAKIHASKAAGTELDESELRDRLISKDDQAEGCTKAKALFRDAVAKIQSQLETIPFGNEVPVIADRIQALVKAELHGLAESLNQIDPVVAENIARGIRPVRVLSLVEWARIYRVLQPVEGPKPGKYKISWVPYLRCIFDAYDDPRVRRIAVKKCSQSALTSGWMNVVGRAIHQTLANIVYVLQNQANLRKLISRLTRSYL